MQDHNITYSLIIPVFNEQEVLPLLVERLKSLAGKLDGAAEIIFVDDGSSDGTWELLKEYSRNEEAFRLIRFSRNFGHQIAITAGMDAACGEAVIVMDADLQDPPEVVLQMAQKWREGFEIVYAQREQRKGESLFKRASAALFYRFLQRMTDIDIPVDTGDFRLIGRRALETFKAMPERQRFVRGMFAWMGYPQAAVKFCRPARAAGETKYPLARMLRLAATGMLSFSDRPLRLALWLGAAVSGMAVLYGLYVMALWLFDASLVPGWASIMIVTSFLSGVNLMMLGIIGLYIGSIFEQVQSRPLYVVQERDGFEKKPHNQVEELQKRLEKAYA